VKYCTMKLLLILVLLLSSALARGSSRQWLHQTLSDIMDPSNYDARVRPSGDNETGPVQVHTNMMIRQIESISEVDMELRMTVSLRMRWLDPRLRHVPGGSGQLRLDDPSEVWTPDVFFKRERSGSHSANALNTYLRLFPDGSVVYSSRLSLSLTCPMDLTTFPFGEIECALTLSSFGHTRRDVVLRWEESPIQLARNLELPNYIMTRFNASQYYSSSNTAEYSCLRVDFGFDREYSNYIFRLFLPSAVLVVVSYLALWLDPACQLPSRLLLCLSSLLGLMLLAAYAGSLTAPVGYATAMDVWMRVCASFALASLLEVVMVSCLVGGGASRSRETTESGIPLEAVPQKTKFAGFVNLLMKGSRVDSFSRVLFPVVFLVFNITYWTTYVG